MMHLIKYPLDETVKRFFEEAAAKGFEMREGQMEMANEICTAITEKRPLAVEAEVGIGKSFAYLVPALIQFFRERRQVIIATSTIALQEQLYHDAQSVLKMLGVHANIILAKGMKNYACMKRVHSLYSRHKNDIYYGRLCQMVRNGQQDKAEITMNISDTEWDKISISNFGKDRCKSCPYTRSCQYHKMRSALVYESAIVICNQNMLVSHLMNQQKGKGLFNPSVNTFIIDEAHNIESKFRSAYTTAYSKSDIMHIVNDSVRNTKKQELKELAEGIAVNIEELFRMFRVQVHQQEKSSEGDVTSFFLDLNTLDAEFAKLYEEETQLSGKLLSLKAQCKVFDDTKDKIESTIAEIENSRFQLEAFDDVLIRKLIECVKVISKTEIIIIFKGGYEAKAEVDKK